MIKRDPFTLCFKKKHKADKFGILNIRFTEQRKSKYFSLKETIKEQYWNKKKSEIRDSCKDYERLNLIKNDKIKELKTLYGLSENIEVVKQNNKNSFLNFFNGQLDLLLQRKRIGTYKSFKSSYYHLKLFLNKKGKTDLLFSDIDINLVTELETYFIKKDLSNNTLKKYISIIKRVFKQSVKMNIYTPLQDPFILFENKKKSGNKEPLVKTHVDKIILKKYSENHPLYHTRKYFLFQIFGQGLRVSDLFTLRWDKINEGEIKFIQFKTKRPHTIEINDIIVFILKDYIPGKLSEVYTSKYKFKYDSIDYSMNYEEIKDKYNEIAKEHIKGFISNNKKSIQIIETWKKYLDTIREKVKFNLIIEITKYSKKNPSLFIFPILRNEDFKEVKFNEETTLSTYQYNQLSSRTTMYNRQLKGLQKECELDIKLTSHISRHTYTNIMIESTNKDIYAISKNLGHTRISTTEYYINEFSTSRPKDGNKEMNKLFSHL